MKLENQEKKLISEIKKSAKNGQMGACKIQAKDLVRTRRYIEKFYSMRTQLQAISLRIQVWVLYHNLHNLRRGFEQKQIRSDQMGAGKEE